MSSIITRWKKNCLLVVYAHFVHLLLCICGEMAFCYASIDRFNSSITCTYRYNWFGLDGEEKSVEKMGEIIIRISLFAFNNTRHSLCFVQCALRCYLYNGMWTIIYSNICGVSNLQSRFRNDILNYKKNSLKIIRVLCACEEFNNKNVQSVASLVCLL